MVRAKVQSPFYKYPFVKQARNRFLQNDSRSNVPKLKIMRTCQRRDSTIRKKHPDIFTYLLSKYHINIKLMEMILMES